MTSDTKTGLALLREPFPANQISKLPKPTAKREVMDSLPKANCAVCGQYHATSKVMHLDYVGHAALTDRLLDADPAWVWEPLAMADSGLPVMDDLGGMWIKLTVCGVTRLGYGHAGSKSGGDAIKEVIGDALRNAGMRFGAALDLWHKGDLHNDEEEGASKPRSTPTKPAAFNAAIAVQEVKAGLSRDDASGAATYLAGLPAAEFDAVWALLDPMQSNALSAAWPA
jgi:hypothetical protein